MHWLTDKDATGEYRIPRIIYSDAYAIGDGRLRRPGAAGHDLPRALRRDLAARPPDLRCRRRRRRDPPSGVRPGDAGATAARDVRGFQSVLLDLGARLGLPGLVDDDGSPKYRDYADYIVRHERAPGVGLLAGWRGDDGDAARQGRAESRPAAALHRQRRLLARARFPSRALLTRWPTAITCDWAQRMGFLASAAPIVLQLYSETLQKFRLAAQGHGALQPPPEHRERVATLLRSAADLVRAVRRRRRSTPRHLPAAARSPSGRCSCTTRGARRTRGCGRSPRATACTCIRTPARSTASPTSDWIARRLAPRHASPCRRSSPPTCSRTRCGRWNAIGKRKGAWKLAKDAPEGTQGLPAQPPDLRRHAEGRLRQCRPGHRPGRVVRPARVDRARPTPSRGDDACAAAVRAAVRGCARRRCERAAALRRPRFARRASRSYGRH